MSLFNTFKQHYVLTVLGELGFLTLTRYFFVRLSYFVSFLALHKLQTCRQTMRERRIETESSQRARARTRTSTISQCVNKLLFIDFQGETLLTCPALNGRHLLLALRLSLLQWRAAGRALAMPGAACCSIVRHPIIQQLSATTFTMRLPFVGYRR